MSNVVNVTNNFAPATLTVERTIDRFGIMNLQPAQRSTFNGQLFFDLVRYPSNRSFNKRFEPPREFFGYVMGMRGNRVINYWPLEFPNQLVYQHLDNASRWQLSLQCFLSAILVTQPPLSPNPFPVQQHTMPAVPISQFRFRLWGNAAGRFTWIYEDSNYPCAQNSRPTTGGTPNPANIPSPVSPDTPITASPAYSAPNDGGLTWNPGPPPAPEIPDGKTYRIGYSFTYVAASTGETVNVSVPTSSTGCPSPFFGPIGAHEVRPGTNGGVAIFVPHYNSQGQKVTTNISGDYIDIVGTFSNVSVVNLACP